MAAQELLTLTLTLATNCVVFKKTQEYQLTRLDTIQVTYWYAATENKECVLLGPTEKIPGDTRHPLTYEEARELANKVKWSECDSEHVLIMREDDECFDEASAHE